MKETIVPIVFSIDNNLVMPACICLSSLMMHANQSTFYDIFILHSHDEVLETEELNRIMHYYQNCNISYVKVRDYFSDAYEVRGITKVTYYRLLIPKLIPQYDKIIYSDVDIIFRSDLTEVYDIEINDEYVAATYDLGMLLSDNGQKYINTIGLNSAQYMQAGFILLNTKKIREDNLISQFTTLYKNKYKFQDQDILNLTCLKRHKLLPFKYNMTDYVYYYFRHKHEYFKDVSRKDIDDAFKHGTIHFNGHKPWKKYCVNFDIWWEYYRKSPYFDQKFYFDFFYKKLDELDQLSLMKRIKILARYFVYGRKKS